MADITHLFGGSFEPPVQQKITKTPEDQFLDDIIAAGLIPPNGIIFDGQLRRFVCAEGAKGKQNGWYIAYDGRIKAGAFGDWRSDFKQTWREDIGRQLDMSEGIEFQRQMKEAKAKAEAERKAKQEEAAETAQSIWDRSTPAPEDHPYLVKKGVKPHGIRLDGMRLVIPIRDADKTITSLQHIDIDGNKRFLKGGAVAGGRFIFNGGSNTVYLAEGFATGASIYEATGSMVVVAFSANQLANVAESIRSQYPASTLVIVADNDEAGAKAAQEAANAARGQVVTIPTPGMDANDYAQSGGDLVELLTLQNEKRRFTYLSDFIADVRYPEWLIEDWFEKDSTVFTIGAPKTGKSYIVIDMALSIAHGIDYMGSKTNQGQVVYMAGEGARGLSARMKVWLDEHGIEQPSENMIITNKIIKMTDPSDVASVVYELQNMGITHPSMLVIDTFQRSAAGIDENAAKDISVFIDNCDYLRGVFNGACVHVVHHAGKHRPGEARGSTVFSASYDSAFVTEKIEEGDSSLVKLSNPMQKDNEQRPDCFFKFERRQYGVDPRNDKPAFSAVLKPVDAPLNGNEKKAKEAITNDKKLFENAWVNLGDFDNGKLYLSGSALSDYIRTHDPGAKDSTLRKRKKTVTDRLESEGFICGYKSGWAVDNSDWESVLRMLRQ